MLTQEKFLDATERAGRTEAKETEAWSPPWTLLAMGTIQDFTSKQMPSGLRSCLSTWQNWKEQREKKGRFFIKENKYGDIETGWSANRSGLGFDGMVAVRLQRLPAPTFPCASSPFMLYSPSFRVENSSLEIPHPSL